MLLRQMKYFAAVVDCNSFTEAAERCYISQSAISQQIRSLEKELGVELIHRSNRKFTLTAAGEYFYAHSKSILSQVEDLTRETGVTSDDIDRRIVDYGFQSCASAICAATAGWNCMKRLPNSPNSIRRRPSASSTGPTRSSMTCCGSAVWIWF